MIVTQEDDWQRETKTDYYLAQIAAEIAQFRRMFTDDSRGISIGDKLLTQHWVEKETQKPITVSVRNPEADEDSTDPADYHVESATHYADGTKKSFEDYGTVEPSPELVENDPKWAAVNANAKAWWGFFLGEAMQEE
jgi:hypothetical protein